ncbi:hypothetical protein CSUI_008786, partial [Cystoisospora suis]
ARVSLSSSPPPPPASIFLHPFESRLLQILLRSLTGYDLSSFSSSFCSPFFLFGKEKIRGTDFSSQLASLKDSNISEATLALVEGKKRDEELDNKISSSFSFLHGCSSSFPPLHEISHESFQPYLPSQSSSASLLSCLPRVNPSSAFFAACNSSWKERGGEEGGFSPRLPFQDLVTRLGSLDRRLRFSSSIEKASERLLLTATALAERRRRIRRRRQSLMTGRERGSDVDRGMRE